MDEVIQIQREFNAYWIVRGFKMIVDPINAENRRVYVRQISDGALITVAKTETADMLEQAKEVESEFENAHKRNPAQSPKVNTTKKGILSRIGRGKNGKK